MLLPNAASDPARPGKGEMSAALNRSTQSGRPAAGLLPHLVPQGATEGGGGGERAGAAGRKSLFPGLCFLLCLSLNM